METGNRVKVIFEAADSLLDQTDISNSHLSILHTGDGLSFSLLNKEKNKFVLLGAYQLMEGETDMMALFEFLSRFTEIPGDVSYAYSAKYYTLIPKALFDETNTEKYLELLSGEKIEHVDYKELDDFVLIYQGSNTESSWVKNQLPNVRVMNNAEVAFNYYQSKYKTSTDTMVVCHVMGGVAEITAIENGTITLYNSFNYKTDQDFVYYVLSVYENLKLSPEQIPLLLSGWISNLSPEIEGLKKYIRNIEWEVRPSDFSYSYTFNDSASHTFNRLYQQALCV